MGYVFISYRSKNQTEADAMRDIFTKNNISWWMAPYSIPAGSNYGAEINKAVKNCSCMFLLLTKDTQDSEFILRELERAVANRKKIITLQIGDVVFNDDFEYFLSLSQIIKVYQIDESTVEIEKVVDAVSSDLSRNHLEAAVGSRHKRSSSSSAALSAASESYELGLSYANSPDFKNSAAEHFFKAASLGHTDAQYRLGLCYYLGGMGVDRNCAEAVKWFESAAEHGHAEAQYMLGECFYNGFGVEKDYAEAVKMFNKASKQGSADACYMLGCCLEFGYGVEQNAEEAAKRYSEAFASVKQNAERGSVISQSRLGSCYYFGRGVEQDYSKAVIWYRKAAEFGEVVAQNNLGVCYEKGYGGLKCDYVQTVNWYQKAAERGYKIAQRNLGLCYYNATGVDRDYSKAFELFAEAAERGDDAATYFLGVCYYNGYGIDKNYSEAFRLFNQVALQVSGAQYMIGVCLYKGLGTEKNAVSALEWLEKALKNGVSKASDYILTIKKEQAQAEYEEGISLYEKKRYKDSVALFCHAAEQGNVYAQYMLGECFYYGRGVHKDTAKALEWLEKARKHGILLSATSLINKIKAEQSLQQYEEGMSLYDKQNFDEAVLLFLQSAEQGNADAQYFLGKCYYEGTGVNKDEAQALQWLEKSAENGKLSAVKLKESIQCEYGVAEYEKGNYKDAVKRFTELAKENNSKAQYCLGKCYFEGKGVKRDYKLSLQWLEKSAGNGNLDASDLIASVQNAKEQELKREKEAQANEKCKQAIVLLDKGKFLQAESLLLEAANDGNAEAQYRLGVYYSESCLDIEYFKADAVKWYAKAAEQGHVGSQFKLGWCYYEGKGVEQNYAEAFKWFEKCASNPNVERIYAYSAFNLARYMLGKCYYYGRGVKQDYSKAFHWYKMSADNGYDYAEFSVGRCYYCGQGVNKDVDTALRYFNRFRNEFSVDSDECKYIAEAYDEQRRPAVALYNDGKYNQAVPLFEILAVNGDSHSQLYLGKCYYDGLGVEQNFSKAFRWYSDAAEEGNAEARYYMGKCYYEGKGVGVDIVKAFYYYYCAAKAGYAEAQYELGIGLHCGFVRKDDFDDNDDIDDDIIWFEKAAEQGHIKAQFYTGMYKEGGYNISLGHYISSKTNNAEKWFKKSAEGGCVPAAIMLEQYYLVSKKKNKSESKEAFTRCFDNLYRLGDNGDADAQYWLGYFYITGVGVQKDKIKAKEWFKKSAENGSLEGIRAMCDYYLNADERLYWLNIADKKGFRWAKSAIARVYLYEKKDFAEAAKRYRALTEQGEDCKKELGKCYYHMGEYDKAFELLSSLSTHFNYYLALCYRNGYGVKKDVKKAKELMRHYRRYRDVLQIHRREYVELSKHK